MLSEFDVIGRFFSRPTQQAVLGGGDDAAIVRLAPGMDLVVSTDMLLAGRHFLADADPCRLGHKALAVNLSDMAAMGARPRWATLALALPEARETWLQGFSRGFYDLAARFGVELIGGDTTRGPLAICVQILGEVPAGQALRRDGARTGDDVWVSGVLGDAAMAVAHHEQRLRLAPDELAACRGVLEAPEPRVALGLALRGVAHACIDVSDGLLADLGHILERSRAGARLELESIPCSGTLASRYSEPAALECLLTGGDDYELCFTAPARNRAKIELAARECGMRVSLVGVIVPGAELDVRDRSGASVTLGRTGYDHFAQT